MSAVWLLALPALLGSTTQTSSVSRFALVVGVNRPLPGHNYARLEYADDDALRFAHFMKRLGARTHLLVAPDEASAERFPSLSIGATPPRRAQLLEALDRLALELEAASKTRREVFIYFSGHGSVSSTGAYLHLLDGRFSRTDMHSKVLSKLRAERMHVIVDSCHSYLMVNRSTVSDRGERVPVDTGEEKLSRYPHVGFLLSTSDSNEVQEWSGYEAGVFSYQVLGALQGAADVDHNNYVTYKELHGYLVAANIAVRNATARVRPFIRRPTVGAKVILELPRRPEENRLVLPPELRGHFYLMTVRGRRVLDGNKEAGQPLRLLLPPDIGLVLWANGQQYDVVRTPGAPAKLVRNTQNVTVQLRPRGAIEDEFRRNLFRRTLTREFVNGLDAALAFNTPAVGRSLELPRSGWRPTSIALMGGGGAAILMGAVSSALYGVAVADASDTSTSMNAADILAARGRAKTARAMMIGGFAGGAALLGAGLIYEWAFGEASPVSVVARPDRSGGHIALGWEL